MSNLEKSVFYPEMEDLEKAKVQKPGSRGGKFWIDNNGKIRYGEKSNNEIGKQILLKNKIMKKIPNELKALVKKVKKYKNVEMFINSMIGENSYDSSNKELGLKNINDYKKLALSSKSESDFIGRMRGNSAGSNLTTITGFPSSGEGWFLDASNFYKYQLIIFYNQINRIK